MESSAKLFQRMYHQRYKAKYPDRVRATQMNYYYSHKEQILENRKRHREKANKWAKNYYYRNKEKVLEKAKLYYQKNRERLKEKSLERYYKSRGITKRQQGKLFYQECVRKFGLP